jgi:hypothetical protein
MSRSSSLHFLRRARRLRGLVGILEEERPGQVFATIAEGLGDHAALMNAGHADRVEFMAWRQGFSRRTIGFGQGKIRMTEPWVLPLALVVAFLAGFIIGYRHGFSQRHSFAHASTSQRSGSRL